MNKEIPEDYQVLSKLDPLDGSINEEDQDSSDMVRIRQKALSFADSDVSEQDIESWEAVEESKFEDVIGKGESPEFPVVETTEAGAHEGGDGKSMNSEYIQSLDNRSESSVYDPSTARRPPSPDYSLMQSPEAQSQQAFESHDAHPKEEEGDSLPLSQSHSAEVFYFIPNALGSSSSGNGGSDTAELYGAEGITSLASSPTMYIQSDSQAVSSLRLVTRQG